ncbi:MAG TPA: hypothetical protein PK680_09855, partial [Novosphingobium sp.]|nr:hypothetical protein [Novosphingobium sp.]
WTAVNHRGHRHFRGAPSGAEGALVPVTPERPGSVVAAGPALAFFWHSGHPGVGRILSEWADAWAADKRGDAAIMAAMRSASEMTVNARDANGRGFSNTYDLRGAATAMDAAAVGCAQLR